MNEQNRRPQAFTRVLRALRTQANLALAWRQVAWVMGFNAGTMLSQWYRYQADGKKEIVSKKPCRARLVAHNLTIPQEWAVRTVLTHRTPVAQALPCALWSRRAVRDLIQAEIGINMPTRTVSEYLKRWVHAAAPEPLGKV